MTAEAQTFLGLPPSLSPHLKPQILEPNPTELPQDSFSTDTQRHNTLQPSQNGSSAAIGGSTPISSPPRSHQVTFQEDPGSRQHLEPHTASISSNTSDEFISSDMQSRLYGCAQGRYDEVWYKFKRFETLSLLNLYHYQHELVELEESVYKMKSGRMKGCFESREERDKMRNLLKEYHLALLRFRDISQMKRPHMEDRQKAVRTLASGLSTSWYTEAPDSLGMVDLMPQTLGVSPDSIRLFVNRTMAPQSHTFFFVDEHEERTPGQKTVGGGRPRSPVVSAAVDRLVRIFMAILAGLFLLVPMITLFFVTNPHFQLITICLFVMLFAIVTATASKASNQDIMMATAAYAAVLVVFLGQASPQT